MQLRSFAAGIAAVAVLVAMPAIAAGKKVPVITEARNEAVGFALTDFLVVRAVPVNCGVDDAALSAKPAAAFERWKTRNEHLVKGASQYFALLKVMIGKDRGQEYADAFGKAQMANFDQNADVSLKTIFHYPARPDAQLCERLATLLDAGKLDLAQKPEYVQTLQEIEADMQVLLAP